MSNWINSLNSVLADWKKRFDFSASVTMEFQADAQGHLLFNGQDIGNTGEDLVLSSADFDLEEISFHFENGTSLSISILWPEDQGPEVSAVFFEKNSPEDISD